MAIKAFNVMNLSSPNLIDPNKVNYHDSIEIIKDELHHAQKSFVKIGWYLKHIDEQKMFEEDGFSDLYEFAQAKFNISRTTAGRFIGICERFSVNHNSPELDDKYSEYGMSQLFEMLPMNEEEIEKVTPDMPVGKIRKIKSQAKMDKAEKAEDITNPSEFEDENIDGQYYFSGADMNIAEYLNGGNSESIDDSSDDISELSQKSSLSKEEAIYTLREFSRELGTFYLHGLDTNGVISLKILKTRLKQDILAINMLLDGDANEQPYD